MESMTVDAERMGTQNVLLIIFDKIIRVVSIWREFNV